MGDPQHEFGTEMNLFEQRLKGWQPARPALDRDRLMFDAGRASNRPGNRIVLGWLTAGMALLALLFTGSGWLNERENRHSLENKLASIRNQSASPSTQQRTWPERAIALARLDPHSYLALRLRWNVGESCEEPDPVTGPSSPSDSPWPSDAESVLRARGPAHWIDL